MRVADHRYSGQKSGKRNVTLQRDGHRWLPCAEAVNWGFVGPSSYRLAFELLFDASSADFAYAKEHAEMFARRCLTALPRMWNLTAAEIVQLVSGMYAVQTSAVNPKAT